MVIGSLNYNFVASSSNDCYSLLGFQQKILFHDIKLISIYQCRQWCQFGLERKILNISLLLIIFVIIIKFTKIINIK